MNMRMAAGALVGAVLSFLVGSTAWAADSKEAKKKPAEATKKACDGRGTAMVVRTKPRKLYLCAGGKAEKTYAVALGSGGVGARTRSNNKTPKGSFPVSAPVEHSKFGLMVPIQYRLPDKKELDPSFGVRGPHRDMSWAGGLNTLVDWTDGALVVATKESIEAIVEWTKKERPKTVHIE